jgi:hypothetical protein
MSSAPAPHPGLHIAQPDRRAMLFKRGRCRWYHLGVYAEDKIS